MSERNKDSPFIIPSGDFADLNWALVKAGRTN